MPVLDLSTLPVRRESGYPPPHDAPIANQRLGVEVARSSGFKGFGAWKVTVEPGGWSSQRHWHTHDEELIVMLAGELVLVEEGAETVLAPGDIAVFRPGVANAHHLINRSAERATFFAVGTDEDAQDICSYPDIGMEWRPGEGYVFPGKAP